MEDTLSLNSSSSSNLVLIRIGVPELNVEKCLQFHKDEVIWEVKQQALAALPKVRRFLYFPAITVCKIQSWQNSGSFKKFKIYKRYFLNILKIKLKFHENFNCFANGHQKLFGLLKDIFEVSVSCPYMQLELRNLFCC